MRLLVPATLTLLALACGGSASSDAANSPPVVVRSVATQVSIDHVSIYQGVKISLVTDGQPVANRNAPVVPRRPAFLRIHAASALQVSAPEQFHLSAELRLHYPDRPDAVLTDGPRTLVPFADSDFNSSFVFTIPAEQVVTGMTYSVDLHDPTGKDPGAFAYTGPAPLVTETFAPTLRVKFVPIKYQADGSNRVPSLDARRLATYHDALFKLYPVADVELSVRDTVAWPLEVDPNGTGWNELLDAVVETRRDDLAPKDVYYMGILNPAPTEAQYCRTGCILGAAPGMGLTIDTTSRSAMVVGYASEHAGGTLAQELAHSMGRGHAPCGNPVGIDTHYPYENASIGSWGYDVLEQKLIDPASRVFDFMSYCGPTWVSDYTYKALYDHMLKVDSENPG